PHQADGAGAIRAVVGRLEVDGDERPVGRRQRGRAVSVHDGSIRAAGRRSPGYSVPRPRPAGVPAVPSYHIALAVTPFLLVFAMTTPNLAADPPGALTRKQASAFARLALKGIAKEYPNKPEHVLAGPADVK